VSNFGSDVEKWCGDTQKKASAVVRKTALDLFTAVIKKTPVDDGSHRGNWMASVGEIDTNYSDTIRDPSGESSVKRAYSVVGGAGQDQDIYLSNSGPAINVLEYGGYPTRGGNGPSNGPKTVNGFSRQAPAGMVRVNIANFEKHFSAAARGEGFTK